MLLEPGLAYILGTRSVFPESRKYIMSRLGIQRLEWQGLAHLVIDGGFVSLLLWTLHQKHTGVSHNLDTLLGATPVFGQGLERGACKAQPPVLP